MSYWSDMGILKKVTSILKRFESNGHHFGRPFITAYQLAIEYQLTYSDDVEMMGLQIGGAGTGSPVSLSQYLSRELSARINSGEIQTIEGALLSDDHLTELTFRSPDESQDDIQSSLIGTGIPLSMYRLRH